ncbi:hypothetical protein V7x_43250 [Crateriforma conspicua]|uniref:Uncharacterized protein n=1 Tax=Crateriforma conspicua TaxID=2527996 RepID=A0A5C6FKE7_9PLAN|nr:hypothetical protein V7x_43250 [Crateriforma conspicua]
MRDKVVDNNRLYRSLAVGGVVKKAVFEAVHEHDDHRRRIFRVNQLRRSFHKVGPCPLAAASPMQPV